MDDKTLAALEDLNEMVNTAGWKVLEEDIQAKIDELKEQVLHTDVTGDLLKIAQGRVLAYKDILSLPVVVTAVLTQEAEVEESDDSI